MNSRKSDLDMKRRPVRRDPLFWRPRKISTREQDVHNFVGSIHLV